MTDNAPFTLSFDGLSTLPSKEAALDIVEARIEQNADSPTKEAVLELLSRLRALGEELHESRETELRVLRKLAARIS